MYLARNVSNQYSTLLPHGRCLTPDDISILRRKYPDISISIMDPLLDDCLEFQDDSRDHEVSREIRHNIAVVSKKISQNIRSNMNLDEHNIAGIQKSIDNMMKFMKENPVTMAILEQSHDWADYLQEHSSNVFYLSMIVGNTIKNYVQRERHRQSMAKFINDAMDLSPLATAALFHDVGMVPIENVYFKEAPLTDAEKEHIRKHPELGAAMLPKKIHPIVHLAVRTHHENHNATGYPLALEGNKICIFARIIRVADAYAAAIATARYNPSKSPTKALYEMLYGKYCPYYDPIVLKVFAGVVKPLPIGAKLRLKNGEYAVVVKHNQQDPFNPLVIIAFDKNNRKLPKESLCTPFNLKDHQEFAAVAFGDEDISYINNTPVAPPLQRKNVAAKQPQRATVHEHSFP